MPADPPSGVELSVVIPAHNPEAGHLRRTLAGLAAQTLPAFRWETVLVDNASQPALEMGAMAADAPVNLRLVREPSLGLTEARKRGFAEARGDVLVLVDADNVLSPDYLDRALLRLREHPRVGVLGGKSLPEFAVPPPPWTREFHALLALRDLGNEVLVSSGLRSEGRGYAVYPPCAPIGAGMVLRRAAAAAWVRELASDARRAALDRRGSELVSGGDNDLVLSAMENGWEAAYFPDLTLVHLIPARRLEAEYLERLNHAMQRSWIQVLAIHGACPWRPISAAGASVRKLRAWMAHPPWLSAAARVRYAGLRGHFEGRARIK
jgi:glycosyltransferase involved in cell wall biosynthesis